MGYPVTKQAIHILEFKWFQARARICDVLGTLDRTFRHHLWDTNGLYHGNFDTATEMIEYAISHQG